MSDARLLPPSTSSDADAARPDLSGPPALPSDAAAALDADGYAVVRGLASPEEVAAYRPAILAAGPKGRYDTRPLAERDTYGQAFVQMLNLWRHDETVRAFVFARRFARAAAELLRVDAVRLYHDQALFKEPGGGFTPWHQDQFYWPLDTPHTVTLWMPLVPVDSAMGAMHFAAGSHRLGSLGDFPIGDASQEAFQRAVDAHGLPCRDAAPLEPGDATFHRGWTLHGAPPNRTARMREVMTVIYYAADARVGSLEHPARRLDRDLWLRGCEPGQPAAGPGNPVLWRRDEEPDPPPLLP